MAPLVSLGKLRKTLVDSPISRRMSRSLVAGEGRNPGWLRVAAAFSVGGALALTLTDEVCADLGKRLRTVQVTYYARARGYSEGPIWRNGELFFGSGAVFRVTKNGEVRKYLNINPSGMYLRGDGHIIICDNKYRALLDLAPDGKVGVIVEEFQDQPLESLNDLTVDRAGNVYWTDPAGSSAARPVGKVFRVRPDGRVDRIATGLAYPNGIDVDPANKYLYVIESLSKKILRYHLPPDDQPLGKPTVFYELGGSGGDGLALDLKGNLWVADYRRPDTGRGRITVIGRKGETLGHLEIPAEVVSNITFGGTNHDEIFITTGGPPGVFHAKVGIRGFKGHAGKAMKTIRYLPIKVME
jgi:gluconolactonase